MPPEFWKWLDSVLEDTGLSESKFSRKAGISPSVFSKARNGVQPIKFEACIAIARAAHVQPEMVLRLAGLLPKAPNWKAEPEYEEWMGLFQDLSGEDRSELLALARMKQQRKHKVK